MIKQIMYHGTEKERGLKMLNQKAMGISRGDKHWLGDGSYFFEEDFFAYNWICDIYCYRFDTIIVDEEELEKFYGIVEGRLNVSPERIFNLDTFKHKLEFDKVGLECRQLKVYSERFNKTVISDGVIINIMFNELRYCEEFDVVVCTFRQKKHKYKGTSSRINFIPQKQICVKNTNCISLIGLFNYKSKTKEYQILLEEYNKDMGANDTHKYSRNKSRRY